MKGRKKGMNTLKLLSWNVNGIRAVEKKVGLLAWLARQSPDILCLQETKARPEQLADALQKPEGYFSYWTYPAEKKGYSGVATFSRREPLDVQYGIGIEEFDAEGRFVITRYPEFRLFNVYFPKGDTAPARSFRLDYKLQFYDAFLEHIDALREKGEKLIICGDFNTAHKEIDLARPKENEKNSGFLPQERAWLDKLLEHGYIDVFRHMHSEPDRYTWWVYKTGARRGTWLEDRLFLCVSKYSG
jgi:exodeoxyribonuclease-3